MTCVREVPAFAFYFGTYDFLCRRAVKRKGLGHVDELSPGFICMAGGVGGMMAWLITYPVDVVKSRYQIDGMFSSSSGGNNGVMRYTCSSAWDCFQQSAKEGWNVL